MAWKQKRFDDGDPWLQQAIRVIKNEDGVDVSPWDKNKDLLRFGRHTSVTNSGLTTIATMPSGITNETYVTSNIITKIISTSTGDGEQVVVEGHTISGNDLTFVTQTATLNGQTAVTLTTPLARCVKVYNNDSTVLQGTISVTQDDTYTAGVPDTASKVHLQIRAGQQESEKASTSISKEDYWLITRWYGDMLTKSSNAFAELVIEARLPGKVFRQNRTGSVSDSHRIVVDFRPYIIVKPNSDIRIRGVSGAAGGRDVSTGIEGILCK